jgi:hypothetical protein
MKTQLAMILEELAKAHREHAEECQSCIAESDCNYDALNDGACTCGADEHNALVERLQAILKPSDVHVVKHRGLGGLPCYVMDLPTGPECWCGRPSQLECGACCMDHVENIPS